MSDIADLWDYRRQVSDAYAAARTGQPSRETWLWWRGERDRLFSTHPQSPIEDQGSFDALPYFEYDARWRVVATFEPFEAVDEAIAHSGDGSTEFKKVGSLLFEVDGEPATLGAFWLDSYGGGMFVPFRDPTNGSATYGGGRYLLDTVKGADLGSEGDRVIMDFNYAYHPSCVHSDRWSCPLAPPENRLEVAIEAGERLNAGPGGP
ncbi:MAG: DUF1684 domain-containing protein [Actinomycetota bacterium]|nr:DUF1684 domain-containing protein [Actinomycetota bacterium]